MKTFTIKAEERSSTSSSLSRFFWQLNFSDPLRSVSETYTAVTELSTTNSALTLWVSVNAHKTGFGLLRSKLSRSSKATVSGLYAQNLQPMKACCKVNHVKPWPIRDSDMIVTYARCPWNSWKYQPFEIDLGGGIHICDLCPAGIMTQSFSL